jgi:predicted ATPase
MIKEISFKNYKAFESGCIEIKPITLLLGANSVGKSSILQLLLMLQQTALTENYRSALRLHGKYAGLGENENIFKDKKTDSDLVLSFEFSDKTLFKLLKGELLEELTHTILRPISYLSNYYFHTTKENKLGLKLSDKTNRILRKDIWKSKDEFIDAIKELENLKTQLRKIYVKDKGINERIIKTDIDFLINSTSDLDNILMDSTNYGIFYDYIKNLNKVSSNNFNLVFNIRNIKFSKEDLLKITKVALYNKDKCIIELSLMINEKKNSYEDFELISSFFSDILKTDAFKDELLRNLNFDSTLFSIFSENSQVSRRFSDDNLSLIPKVIIMIINNSIQNIKNSFERRLINYVSPLRAHPKRYYFLDKANINIMLDTLDGDSLTEVLKENNVVKTKVNKWLKNFGLSVDVSTLQDVIHRLKVTQHGLSLDITDVGFGISQVLPVIVQGFLSFNGSLTIIEQPEIHLHPKMQADLADLFIDIVKSENSNDPEKYLIIETHSEYLLKRLRRRMAENKKISPDDVAIYYFHPRNEAGTGVIERKKISETGFFDYPQDFYGGELLRDNTEFIKHQIRMK